MIRLVCILTLLLACKPVDEHEHGHDDHGHDDHGHDDHGHDDHGHDDHGHDDHGHDDHAHDEHGHGHGEHVEGVTRWGETLFAYVEFEHLIVGQHTGVLVHLTRRADHHPVREGNVQLGLGGRTLASSDEPSQAGIFRLEIEPERAGDQVLTLAFSLEGESEELRLGEHTVFASESEADHDTHEHADPPGAIEFLLEEQWRTPFGVEPIETRVIRPNIPAFARLASPNDAESMITAPRAGRVVAIDVFPVVGGEVEEGERLFAVTSVPQDGLDPASLDLAIAQANIRVQSAQREVDRLTPLVAQGVVAQRRLDDANSTLAGARAELRSAQRHRGLLSQSQRVGGRRDGLRVPSPITGTIAEIYVAPGAWVTEGQRIARIVDRGGLWLNVGVPETYVSQLASVSGAWFTLSDRTFELPREALVSVGTEVRPDSRTLPVRFRVDNEARELFAGVTTLAHLLTDEGREATAVPYASIVDDGGVDVVYVQLSGESFERRIVRLGIRDGDFIEILAGVEPGEWVVSRGAYAVKIASTKTESLGHGHAH